jgi:decaprenyl-phosphate phosphoribosyltransferase
MPVFFASRLNDPAMQKIVAIAFLGFSLVASAVYILNDTVDKEWDQKHPRKRNRPIASGAVPQKTAMITLFLSLISGLVIVSFTGTIPLLLAVCYFLLNLLYSFWLKHVAILDVSIIGLCFLIRIYLGGAATGVVVSNWLTVLTFIIALILGLAKRRGEYIIFTEQSSFRKSLEGYNLPFLNASIIICITMAIVAYLMYCFSPEVTQRIGSDHIYFTSFFVVIGLLRFLQLALVGERTESPIRLLWEDHFLQVVLFCWIANFIYLLY